jgi:hypothetical protein
MTGGVSAGREFNNSYSRSQPWMSAMGAVSDCLGSCLTLHQSQHSLALGPLGLTATLQGDEVSVSKTLSNLVLIEVHAKIKCSTHCSGRCAVGKWLSHWAANAVALPRPKRCRSSVPDSPQRIVAEHELTTQIALKRSLQRGSCG